LCSSLFDRKNRFDEIAVFRTGFRFHLCDVAEIADAVCDGALEQRRAFIGRHDADHVDDLAAVADGRIDMHDLQLRIGKSKRCWLEAAARFEARIFLVDGHAEHRAACDDEKAHGMNWHDRAGRQHGALHALLSALRHEGRNVLEIAELRLVDAGLGAHRHRVAHLRDDDADLICRNLHHRMARDVVERPQFELQSRMQQLRLIAGLAVERDRIAAGEFAHAEAFAHETHFRRSDVPRRSHQDDEEDDRHGDKQRFK
jgi:hypothetical protein